MNDFTEQAVFANKSDFCRYRDNFDTMRREAVSIHDGKVKFWVSANVLLQIPKDRIEELGSIGAAPWGALRDKAKENP